LPPFSASISKTSLKSAEKGKSGVKSAGFDPFSFVPNFAKLASK
jgi:hypothetical protein